AYFSKTGNDRSSSGASDTVLLENLEKELQAVETFCRQSTELTDPVQNNDSNEKVVATLIAHSIKVKNGYQQFHRAEEWEREYQRICTQNSTLSNVHMTLFQARHQMHTQDVVFRPGEAEYERMTIFLHDPDCDGGGTGRRPLPFLFLPSLPLVLKKGIECVTTAMIASLYTNLIKLGYFATQHVKNILEPQLLRFFLSGFLPNTQIIRAGGGDGDVSRIPLSLKARFDPTSPLAMYIHGPPGSGKSSFARNFPIALQDTLAEFADPECFVRLVKQNLNKTMSDLELELELRPNNNDMSLMSIIQSRKQKMSQAKRGLVILNMEEMPRYDESADPDQSAVIKLVCHRFGGRKGDYRQCDEAETSSCDIATKPPRNSTRLGIGNDYSLVTIFTSNYPLKEASHKQLHQLGIFQELVGIEMFSISGPDRIQFSKSYFLKALEELDGGKHEWLRIKDNLELDMLFSEGDTRPMIKTLRILAYYLSILLDGENASQKLADGILGVSRVQIQQKEQRCSIKLFSGAANVGIFVLLRSTMDHSECWFPESSIDSGRNLEQILNLWSAKALAPAVVLSRCKGKAARLMKSLTFTNESRFHCIRNIHVDKYKMSKSLYDRNETPNLRDDILKFGRGALVAVELICPTEESQLLCREMIEDSPSMTAFSSLRSSLYKDGLLFLLVIEGNVTPEVASRVTFEL
ncbi:MAG: hypothetical protein SGILL_007925, partial [Bacillariaceae sp.]